MASEEQNNVTVKDDTSTKINENQSNNNYNSKEEDCFEPIYIKVAEDENEEAVELPCEKDNSILLSTLTSQFPGASGLRYRSESNAMRGLRLADGKFISPEKGWSAYNTYFCVFPRDFKRKLDEGNEKSKKGVTNKNKCSDLIVLGLPWKITEEELKDYFEQFGEIVMVQIKKDPKSGQSKGFGFVKFLDYDTQMSVVAKRHNIFGRWCDVRIPLSKGEEQFSYQSSEFNRKIFVGRITEDFTCEDLRNYFKKFGDISDVFIPKPFRAFAFITFKDSETAQQLCGEDHLIKSVSVHVSNAVPKVDFNASGYNQTYHHSGSSSNNHHYGNQQHHHHSNYHHNQRYNPYKHLDQRRSGGNHYQRGGNNHQTALFNNQANSSLHTSNGNPLVNSTYNPMAMPISPQNPPIWTSSLGTHVTNGTRDLPPGIAPVANVSSQYGMNPLNAPQKHYGQH